MERLNGFAEEYQNRDNDVRSRQLGSLARIREEIVAGPQDDHLIRPRQLAVDQPAPPLRPLHGLVLHTLAPDEVLAAIGRRQTQSCPWAG